MTLTRNVDSDYLEWIKFDLLELVSGILCQLLASLVLFGNGNRLQIPKSMSFNGAPFELVGHL